MISNHFMNNAAPLLITGGIEIGAMALAGSVIGPIGAGAGAAFGAVRLVSRLFLGNILSNPLNGPGVSDAAKALALALVIFGAPAAAWGALSLAGVSLTFCHILQLSIVGGVCQAVTGIVAGCLLGSISKRTVPA